MLKCSIIQSNPFNSLIFKCKNPTFMWKPSIIMCRKVCYVMPRAIWNVVCCFGFLIFSVFLVFINFKLFFFQFQKLLSFLSVSSVLTALSVSLSDPFIFFVLIFCMLTLNLFSSHIILESVPIIRYFRDIYRWY